MAVKPPPPKKEDGNTLVDFDGKGHMVTARVRDCLLAWQALYRKKSKQPKFKIQLAQGSFNDDVPASGSTHFGDAVADIRTRAVGIDTPDEIRLFTQCGKQVGAQPFVRDERDRMPPHVHSLFATDAQMSDSAKWQVAEYDAGRNGLTNRKRDRNPYRVKPKLRYSYTQGKAVPRP